MSRKVHIGIQLKIRLPVENEQALFYLIIPEI